MLVMQVVAQSSVFVLLIVLTCWQDLTLTLVGHWHFHWFPDVTAACHYLLDPSPSELSIPSSHVPSAYLMSDISPLTGTGSCVWGGGGGLREADGPCGGS